MLDFEYDVMIGDLTELETEFDDKKCKDLAKKIEAGIYLTRRSEKSFCEHHRKWLYFHKAMHVSQLIPKTLDYLNSLSSDTDPEFECVIVDEYQDLNSADQQLVEAISKKSRLIVAGDDNQSIYGFRYANSDSIKNFHKRGPPEKIFLDMCNRTPRNIVRVANNLIAKNAKSGQDCLPLCPNKWGGKIRIIQWETQKQEFEGISEYVKHILDSKKCQKNEILILTPTNDDAHKIYEDINSKGIEIRHYGKKLYNSEQKSFALLTLLNNCEDRVALRWWLGHNESTRRFKLYQKLRKYCESNKRSPKSVLDDMINAKLALPDLAPLLEPYRDLVKELASLAKLNWRCDLIDNLLPDNKPDHAFLRKIAKDALKDSNSLCELYDNIRMEIVQPQIPDDNSVKVMTLHKAKGLSSKVVIVTGCVEELLSGTNETRTHESIEEYRRLFYVALTRCEDILILSYPTTLSNNRAKPPPESNKAHPSRFLEELGPTTPDTQDGIEWQASGYKT